MSNLVRKVRLVPIFMLVAAIVLIGGSLQPASAQTITYSSNTTLSADIFCNNLTINPGVTLTTNGHNIYCSGTFINNGVIQTGFIVNGGVGANESPAGATSGGTFPNSYGGSGGGGGGSSAVTLGPAQISGSGGSTLAAGGSGGTEFGGSCGTGGGGASGSSATAPSITNALIRTWISQGMSTFLAGGGGGGGAGSGYLCSDTGGSAGGSGAFGIYIQANEIVGGSINAFGQDGGTAGSGGGGGGGGGTILLSYGTGGYTAGPYNTNGGGGGLPGTNGGGGGSGGNGLVRTFSYGTNPPVQLGTLSWGYCFNAAAGDAFNVNNLAFMSCVLENQSSPNSVEVLSFTQEGIGVLPTGTEPTVAEDIATDLLNGGVLNASVNVYAVAFQSLSGEALNAQPYSYVNASTGVGIFKIVGVSAGMTVLQSSDQSISGFMYGLGAGICIGCLPSPVTFGIMSGILDFDEVTLPTGPVNPVQSMNNAFFTACLLNPILNSPLCAFSALPVVGPSALAWVQQPSLVPSETNFAYLYAGVNDSTVPSIAQSASPGGPQTPRRVVRR